MKWKQFALWALLGLCMPVASLAEDPAPTTDHKIKIDLRYRFETVDQASFDRDASASTLRTALSYSSPQWKGWSLFLQAENVAPIFDDDSYNNAGRDGNSNGVFGRPVVADPAVTDMNQAYLRWRGESLTATLGRQEINVGDQRFVGAVGWRQNHQSFDALRLQWQASPRIDVDYAYVRDVHRIFGDRLDASHHLLTVPIRWGSPSTEPGAGGTVTPYGYLLDWEFPTSASTLTAGVEWKGSVGRWHWELEAAQQEDAADNPVDIDTAYRRAEGGANWSLGASKLGVSLDWESLESGDGRSFQTPLATLHKWNGWADLFLNTPSAGLETTTLRVTGSSGPWAWQVAYLDHQAERFSLDYGTEIDGQLTWNSEWGQTFALKFADYDADRFGSDVTKAMFFTTYSFGT